MRLNDREFVAVPTATRDAVLDNFDEVIGIDADMAPRVARVVAEITGMTPSEIIERGVKAAGKMTDEQERKLRRRMAKEIRKSRDAQRRGYVARTLDDAARQAELEEGMTKERQRRAVKRAVDAEEIGQADEGDDYADVAALIEKGVERRVPDAGALVSDSGRLAYSGAVNGLVGPPESGKTLVAIASACDTLKAGGSVLHIDADHNGADATLSHYLAADGVDPDDLADRARFRYVEVRSADHLRRVVAEAAAWSPEIVIVDSVGEVVPLFGGDSNSNDDYRRIHREILSPFADLGAAVLVLDHVTKEEGRGGYAIGAGAKKAAIDGSYLAVTPVEPFVPGVGGAAALTILKDRHGGVRAQSPAGKSPTAAVFRLDSRGGSSTWEFWRGKSAEERGDDQAEADIEHVLSMTPFPESRPKLQAALKAAQGKAWGNDRAYAALTEAKRRRESAATTFPIESKE